jgi:hypothetical protein
MIGLLADEEKTRILLTRIGEKQGERGPPASRIPCSTRGELRTLRKRLIGLKGEVCPKTADLTTIRNADPKTTKTTSA